MIAHVLMRMATGSCLLLKKQKMLEVNITPVRLWATTYC